MYTFLSSVTGVAARTPTPFKIPHVLVARSTDAEGALTRRERPSLGVQAHFCSADIAWHLVVGVVFPMGGLRMSTQTVNFLRMIGNKRWPHKNSVKYFTDRSYHWATDRYSRSTHLYIYLDIGLNQRALNHEKKWHQHSLRCHWWRLKWQPKVPFLYDCQLPSYFPKRDPDLVHWKAPFLSHWAKLVREYSAILPGCTSTIYSAISRMPEMVFRGSDWLCRFFYVSASASFLSRQLRSICIALW